MEIILVIGLITLAIWVWQLHIKFERRSKLSELAESVLWNTLLENKVITQEIYEDARDRFNRNIKSALTSEKKKQAQIRALRALLQDGSKEEIDA